MASLKEVKNRINSVKSTRQITSAMKMVASAKLHKAQGRIESMYPYQQKLIVYFFESELCPVIYGMDEPVPIAIYDGALEIRFEHIKRWIEKE